jgi:hypothetical protein
MQFCWPPCRQCRIRSTFTAEGKSSASMFCHFSSSFAIVLLQLGRRKEHRLFELNLRAERLTVDGSRFRAESVSPRPLMPQPPETISLILSRGFSRPQDLRHSREATMKRCAQCHGKLGLGVRSRNLWSGRWLRYTRFCSAHCERIYEQERNEAAKHRWHAFLARGNSQS